MSLDELITAQLRLARTATTPLRQPCSDAARSL